MRVGYEGFCTSGRRWNMADCSSTTCSSTAACCSFMASMMLPKSFTTCNFIPLKSCPHDTSLSQIHTAVFRAGELRVRVLRASCLRHKGSSGWLIKDAFFRDNPTAFKLNLRRSSDLSEARVSCIAAWALLCENPYRIHISHGLNLNLQEMPHLCSTDWQMSN